MSVRTFLVWLLCLLLLGMQQEGYRHALAHDQALWSSTHRDGVSTPQSDACSECALLAAAAGAIPSSPALAVSAQAPSQLIVESRPEAPAVNAPSFYRSRAPPQSA